MKIVLFNVFIIIIFVYSINCSLKDAWKEFKEEYNKTYNIKEERRRFRYFKMNLKEIRKHNRRFHRGLETFEKGLNEFADLNADEFKRRYGLYETPRTVTYDWFGKKDNISLLRESNEVDHFDWREKGAVTPAKDQGACGSCWIYSSVGVLESYHFRKFGQLVPLSEQNIVDCFIGDTCMGGLPANAFAFVRKHGINSQSDYPNYGKQRKCNPIRTKYINVTYEKLMHIDNSEEDMKNNLIRHGPMAICMYVTKKWRFYKRGVWFDNECSEETNHSMMLVGFGTENGHDYWLIKNSWGRTWGDDGYIKVMRNRHKNYCGITNESLYLI